MSSGNGCGLCKIKIENIGVKKGGEVLLSDVSFELHCGELTAVIGVNGAGKTTLIKAILGEIRHEGSVSFESHDGEKIGNITIGYVPQHLDFDKSAPISVEDFLLTGRTNSPICFRKNKKLIKEIDDALDMVGCRDLKKRPLGALSGGELQRVMLVNALHPLPELLILDEPVSGVDALGSERFYETIDNLRHNYHMAIAMVSHDLGIVRDYADNVLLINKSVLKKGSAQEVFDSGEFKNSFFCLGEKEEKK
ncbi:MAG: metal ABC transporter ATP-binding protein [Ruminococcaceae bacterium]|nr:metal ABC transporter ATP-binding protein [Oscillospiraceae bacterium]